MVDNAIMEGGVPFGHGPARVRGADRPQRGGPAACAGPGLPAWPPEVLSLCARHTPPPPPASWSSSGPMPRRTRSTKSSMPRLGVTHPLTPSAPTAASQGGALPAGPHQLRGCPGQWLWYRGGGTGRWEGSSCGTVLLQRLQRADCVPGCVLCAPASAPISLVGRSPAKNEGDWCPWYTGPCRWE
jgi:hypothetical protein